MDQWTNHLERKLPILHHGSCASLHSVVFRIQALNEPLGIAAMQTKSTTKTIHRVLASRCLTCRVCTWIGFVAVHRYVLHGCSGWSKTTREVPRCRTTQRCSPVWVIGPEVPSNSLDFNQTSINITPSMALCAHNHQQKPFSSFHQPPCAPRRPCRDRIVCPSWPKDPDLNRRAYHWL